MVLSRIGRLDVVRATRSVKLCRTILTINRRSSYDLPNNAWHGLRSDSPQIVKTIRKNRVIPRSRIALETWLAELRCTTALSDLGPVFLSLQISELENKCAAMRKQMHHKAKSEASHSPKKRSFRSAA